MKKTIVVLLIMMNIVSVNASSNDPKYKIIANSNSDKDIKTMYETKDDLIKDYKDWIKSVWWCWSSTSWSFKKIIKLSIIMENITIVLGAGKGKELTGTLKASYCVSSKEIKKKSFFAELFS